jgi:hypothetical protein
MKTVTDERDYSQPSSSMEKGRVEVWPRRPGEKRGWALAPSKLFARRSARTSIPDPSPIEGEGSFVQHPIVPAL